MFYGLILVNFKKGKIMDEKKNITEKLQKLVIKRERNIVVAEQENNYKNIRSYRNNLASESFYHNLDDE